MVKELYSYVALNRGQIGQGAGYPNCSARPNQVISSGNTGTENSQYNVSYGDYNYQKDGNAGGKGEEPYKPAGD
jgi:hypothetical protein